jgi:hypothetical protein
MREIKARSRYSNLVLARGKIPLQFFPPPPGFENLVCEMNFFFFFFNFQFSKSRDWQKVGVGDRQTDRQTDRQAGRQADRQKEIKRYKVRDIKRDRKRKK